MSINQARYAHTPLGTLVNVLTFVNESWNSFEDLWGFSRFEGAHALRRETPWRGDIDKARACAQSWYQYMMKSGGSHFVDQPVMLAQFDRFMSFEAVHQWAVGKGLHPASIVDLLVLLSKKQREIYGYIEPGAPIVTTRVSVQGQPQRTGVPILYVGHRTLSISDEGCRDSGGWQAGTLFLFKQPA